MAPIHIIHAAMKGNDTQRRRAMTGEAAAEVGGSDSLHGPLHNPCAREEPSGHRNERVIEDDYELCDS
jgi:hypothetical protein